jgi:hypothetical protein
MLQNSAPPQRCFSRKNSFAFCFPQWTNRVTSLRSESADGSFSVRRQNAITAAQSFATSLESRNRAATPKADPNICLFIPWRCVLRMNCYPLKCNRCAGIARTLTADKISGRDTSDFERLNRFCLGI